MKKEKITEEEITTNLERCPHFDACSQNLCPLDFHLYKRVGGERNKCRWMREASKAKIGNREFISHGRVMPNGILNFVPRSNLEWLNTPSQERWREIHK